MRSKAEKVEIRSCTYALEKFTSVLRAYGAPKSANCPLQ
jgi:hypothetical protein